MGSRLSGLGSALYDSKRREFLGRDGARWGKLGIFYFFFYLGLAGFFCAMLAIFMAFTPRDHPRYSTDASRMRTRSNPLSPGLGFRPQPQADKSLIVVDRDAPRDAPNSYVENLDKYLQVYYWKRDKVEKRVDDNGNLREFAEKPTEKVNKFIISNPGDCKNSTQYGFSKGKPCILVKMNKIYDFEPSPGFTTAEDQALFSKVCGQQKANSIPVHCYGEYPADVDNIGTIDYISENGYDSRCGSLATSWFPYRGKYDRKDLYQAPYVWVQFKNPKPNVLINVICRVFGSNIDFDKKTGRALTRFQIYVKDISKGAQARQSRDL